MLFSCDEADIEEIVPVGDSRRLIELVNDVEELCNPFTCMCFNRVWKENRVANTCRYFKFLQVFT